MQMKIYRQKRVVGYGLMLTYTLTDSLCTMLFINFNPVSGNKLGGDSGEIVAFK